MRQRNGYGMAGTTAQPRTTPRPASRHRAPVTARGREVLENSRRRASKLV
jgi:hypothetical protein